MDVYFIKFMRSLLFVYVLLSLPFPLVAQEVNLGHWRGLISYSQAEVPFSFEIEKDEQGSYIVKLKNGLEVITLATRWESDSLIIPLHSFDAEIIAHVSQDKMVGRWVKYYKNNASKAFSAYFDRPRFDVQSSMNPVKVPAKLKMTIEPENAMAYEALGLFEQQGNAITGTILADVGDFRYFEGVVTDDSLMISSFDGVHGLLLKGSIENGLWKGEFVMDDNYSESWSGVEDEEFDLPDPFVATDPSDPGKLEPYFDILTAGSGFGTLNPDDFFGKVTIIQLMGSWCPNSLDETRYLVNWYEQNKNRDVEILSVFYEMNYSKEYGMQRIRDYVAKNNIPYRTALGGPANKGQAALAFPFISKVQAFPTLMILDKLGQVRYMHAYFQGPATGSYYKEFDRRFNEIIEELLEE